VVNTTYRLTIIIDLMIEDGTPLLCSRYTGAAIALSSADDVIDLAHALRLLIEEWEHQDKKPNWAAA